MFRDRNRLLTERGIRDEQNFSGGDGFFQADKLLHHRSVDLETARRVDNEVIAVVRDRAFRGIARDFTHVHVSAFGIDFNADFFAEDFELVDCGGTVDVACGEKDAFSAFPDIGGEFCAGSGFAAAVQTDHHNDVRTD